MTANRHIGSPRFPAADHLFKTNQRAKREKFPQPTLSVK